MALNRELLLRFRILGCELGLNSIQIRECLIQRNPGLESTSNSVEPAELPRHRPRRVHGVRHPKIHEPINGRERRRHDADDRNGLTVDLDNRADDVRIGVQTVAPILITDDGYEVGTEALLVVGEAASKRGLDAPQLEETGSGRRPSNVFRPITRGVGDVLRVVRGDRLESGVSLGPVEEPDRWNGDFDRRRFLNVTDICEPVGLGERQRPTSNTVSIAENTAPLAPIATANVTMTVSANPGDLARTRMA